jgi:hypothetical protein
MISCSGYAQVLLDVASALQEGAKTVGVLYGGLHMRVRPLGAGA